MVFIDTSAFLAVLNRTDTQHQHAVHQWRELVESNSMLVCTNYVVVETLTLLQRRFGLEAVRTFENDFAPLLSVEWVDAETHRAGVSAVLTAGRRNLSLTDCVSFECMRRRGIRQAFTFDRHFAEQGFEVG
jgi:predicted nucleic acid-binding protein